MLPFEKYIPKVLQENLDNYGQAFIDYVDNLFTLVKKETIDLKYFYTAELIPDVFLDTIGSQFAAGILSSDTEKQKRIKILNAIAGHKKRSLWEDDIKKDYNNVKEFLVKLQDNDFVTDQLLIKY